jgi:putative transposase
MLDKIVLKKQEPRMKEWHHNRSITKLGYHIIICPKYRHSIIKGAVEVELKHIIVQSCRANDWIVHEIEMMPDHVHLFVQIPHTVAIVDVVKTIKSISAVHIFDKFPQLKGERFWGSGLWSKGAYYATVGAISEDAVRAYIQNQKLSGAE